jgi:hypothetical protein
MGGLLGGLFRSGGGSGKSQAAGPDDAAPRQSAALGKAVSEQRAQLDIWLQRHSRMPPASGKKNEQRQGLVAMVAIASDPKRLLNVTRQEARQLALEATAAMETLSKGSNDAATQAAIKEVAGNIREWRDHVQRFGEASNGRAPGPARVFRNTPAPLDEATLDTQTVIEHAVADFPQTRPEISLRLFYMTLKMGVRGLVNLGQPPDGVFALGAVRFAAGGLAGRTLRVTPATTDCMTMLGIIQEWSDKVGRNPFDVAPFGGRWGSHSERVVAMLSDARICAKFAAELPTAKDPSFQIWPAAIERHAYAMISLKETSLDDTSFDEASFLMTAAARYADRLIKDPTLVPPEIPGVDPKDGPYIALTAARSLLGRDELRKVLAPPGKQPEPEPIPEAPVAAPRPIAPEISGILAQVAEFDPNDLPGAGGDAQKGRERWPASFHAPDEKA